jgi:glyoxylase-like metal-dependent hydrolase (beta-lactamase superfamily II)
MIFIQIHAGCLDNFAYVIGDEKTKIGVVVDPSSGVDEILKIIKEKNLKIKYILNTHSHSDHTSGNGKLAVKTGAKIVMHEKAPAKKDIAVKDGDVIQFGNLNVKVIHTPGHSPDSVCFLIDNKLLTGDTLFVGECGRTDIFGGSSEELYDSLFNKLINLDDDIEVYPGHDYGDKPSSTMGFEKKHNYTLKPRSKEEFIKFMS